jgi:hypothetical protein
MGKWARLPGLPWVAVVPCEPNLDAESPRFYGEAHRCRDPMNNGPYNG